MLRDHAHQMPRTDASAALSARSLKIHSILSRRSTLANPAHAPCLLEALVATVLGRRSPMFLEQGGWHCRALRLAHGLFSKVKWTISTLAHCLPAVMHAYRKDTVLVTRAASWETHDHLQPGSDANATVIDTKQRLSSPCRASSLRSAQNQIRNHVSQDVLWLFQGCHIGVTSDKRRPSGRVTVIGQETAAAINHQEEDPCQWRAI